MRKILASLMVAILCIVFSGIAMADSQVQDSIVWCNVNDTAVAVGFAFPTTTDAADRVFFEPGKHRLLRFELTNIASISTEMIAAVYDSASIAAAGNQQIEGEIESNDSDSVEEVYIRPLAVKNGLVVRQGAYTILLVEYERYRP